MKLICPAGHEADMRQVKSVTCRCGRLFRSMKAGKPFEPLVPMVVAKPGQDVITKIKITCPKCGALNATEAWKTGTCQCGNKWGFDEDLEGNACLEWDSQL
jgi:hypothetical protein